jgi:hypothetical protein
MDEELAVVHDELEAEDLEDDAGLGDAATTGGKVCNCGTM